MRVYDRFAKAYSERKIMNLTYRHGWDNTGNVLIDVDSFASAYSGKELPTLASSPVTPPFPKIALTFGSEDYGAVLLCSSHTENIMFDEDALIPDSRILSVLSILEQKSTGSWSMFGGFCQQYSLKTGLPVGEPVYTSIQDSVGNRTIQEIVVSYGYLALLTFQFLHCKNVSLREHLPPELEYMTGRKLRKYEERHPIHKHHTLVLNLPGKRGNGTTPPTAPSVESITSAHLCRGHFSTYTKEKPLFGKYVGTYWIPAHVRGSRKVGEIYKDYSIKVTEGKSV